MIRSLRDSLYDLERSEHETGPAQKRRAQAGVSGAEYIERTITQYWLSNGYSRDEDVAAASDLSSPHQICHLKNAR